MTTALATGAIGAAVATWQVAILRAFSWISRGIRSPARDAMLSDIAPADAYGRAFGLERAGDNLGAVAGPLLAAGLVGWIGVRPTLYLAAVPGLFAALAITIAASEAKKCSSTQRTAPISKLRVTIPPGLGQALVPIAAFELGNMATTLLILRATRVFHQGERSLAVATSLAILLYAAYNLVGSGAAYAAGHWLDRRNARTVFVSGALLYSFSYLLFGLSDRGVFVVFAFLLAGGGIGLTETAESTLFARLLSAEDRGSGFGILGGVQAFGDFASSAIVGLLWTTVGVVAAFVYAAGLVAVAALIAATRPLAPTSVHPAAPLI